MKIEQRDINSIRPYDRNPRRNDAAVDAVAESIDRFGFRQPIVIDADGVIVIGHTRWRAAHKLGLAQVPVHVVTDLAPERIRALRIADNKTNDLAEWDTDLLVGELRELDADLAIGFGDEELAALLADEPVDRSAFAATTDPPARTWVLIGIPTVRYGEIAGELDMIAAVDGVYFETCVAGEKVKK